ncbi:PREDICTED: reticulon-like protein B12 [Populus euphratica]|uniref:Reticulon-like protein n=1 Tax=Populus euphratica TaxID=75702 RepID=A0AAJ6TEP7_POPEU|nr:PREDICTED: reticulon-like protein B12 [Populus euphratica]XP_011009146.1 PREDICTED: reticulon-like protein B12 [Populus euphratica]
MGSSSRLFNRQRTVHEIFGGGFVADVILWRQMNITLGILLVTLSSWVVFERSGYTLLSLVSSVLLLLAVILFLWAKSAAILNRPAPPLPRFHLSEETVTEVASLIRTRLNALLSISQDIALGKDTKLFLKVAAYLLLISVVGGLTDFLTLGYASLLIVLTIPALYERYEDYLDRYAGMVFKKSHQLYLKVDVECIGRVQNWILERQKLS